MVTKWYEMDIIGDNQSIRVWDNHWILGGTLQSLIEGPLMPNEEHLLVSTMRNNHTWTLDSLLVPLPMQIVICLVSSASKYLYQQKHVPLDKPLWTWI